MTAPPVTVWAGRWVLPAGTVEAQATRMPERKGFNDALRAAFMAGLALPTPDPSLVSSISRGITDEDLYQEWRRDWADGNASD